MGGDGEIEKGDRGRDRERGGADRDTERVREGRQTERGGDTEREKTHSRLSNSTPV